MKKFLSIFLPILLITMGGAYYIASQDSYDDDTLIGVKTGGTADEKDRNDIPLYPDISVVAENLEIPWDIVFLPVGDYVIAERPGTILWVESDSTTTIPITIDGVRHQGEGGLLGMTLHPEFEKNNWIYFYITKAVPGSEITKNSVERFVLRGNTLSLQKVIIDNIPGARYHDGGRIAFGPDGLLYVTTGDATMEDLAQDKASLAGKILRVTDSGEVPPHNPFGTAVYSYGHRNPQGLAWDKDGNLWSTEHGRSGVLSGLDELNLIEPGKNYGWPVIQGDEIKEGMVPPVLQSGPDVTWAPASAVYYDGSIFFGGLRGETLYEAKLDGKKVTKLVSHFYGGYGRIRTVVLGPDGYLYFMTSNRDGRGDVREGDDKIIRVNPKIFR